MPEKSPFPDLDIPKVNVLTYLFPTNELVSDEPYLFDSVDPSICLSKKQLLHRVKRLATGLDRLGVSRGEVVLIFSGNHLHVPVAYLGVVGSQRVFSGANPIYTVPEVAYQIKDTEAKAILVQPGLIETCLAAAKQAHFPANRIFQFSDAPCPSTKGVQDWEEFLGSDEEAEAYVWPELDGAKSVRTIATINYSSGTTGLPKGVCVSHHNIIANVEQSSFVRDEGMPYDPQNKPEERWNAFLPLYHAYGQLYTILMALKVGAKVYVMKKFEYEAFLQVIEKYKVTHMQVAPPIIVMLGRRPETNKYDLSSLRSVVCGAAPLSRDMQNEISTRFKVQINQAWGMTEVTCCGCHVPGGMVDTKGSVGFLLSNCEIKLLDDDGQEVKTSEPGEIFVRGPNICMGYWRNEKATKETIDPDGWLKTGDIAVRDEKGMYYIVDRKKELIKVNGLQVAPAELEAVLLQHEAVADAAVVGVTLHGEECPRAYVALQQAAKGKITGADIQDWIKPLVAKHKHLTGGVAFVDQVPKSASGKILRKILREWAKKDVPRLENQIKARL